MGFKIETHLHTAEASACATATGAEQAIYRKQDGYDAIIVTDHFYRGYTKADRNKSWDEFIDEFCSGYENAKKKGDEIGIKVFFGWEENFDGSEMLVYGLGKDFLKAHPEMIHWTPEENYKHIHEAGGFVVQAHPYRLRGYNKGIHLYPKDCDAVEVENKGNYDPEENVRALYYAKSYNLPMTGGSDVHHKEPGGGGMIFDKEINTIFDYIEYVKSGVGYEIL